MRLPLKFGILQLVAGTEGVTNEELAKRVALRYGGERQAREKTVADHLTALETTGMIVCRPLSLWADGSLEKELTLTPYGREQLRYLPRWAPGA
jgi:hypothetical protein